MQVDTNFQAVKFMVVEEKTGGSHAPGDNRREHTRHVIDEIASIALVKAGSAGSATSCRVIDLSLGGCLLQSMKQFPGVAKDQVEVTFKIHGISLQFNGTIQWTDSSRKHIGISFVNLSSRRKDELAEILREIEAENLAKAKKRAEWQAEMQALAPKAAGRTQSYAVVEQSRPTLQPAEVQLPGQPPIKLIKEDRRADSRHEVDTSAVIYLVNVGAKLSGRILDLSLSGCRIRTDQRFPVDIYTRVETEFRLEGLPFRLGGVIQAIHDRDRHSVGIRFLNVSDRKREQVEQLIAEIQEMRSAEG